MIGVVKSVLKKAKQSGNDPQISLLCLRRTPIDSRTPSPAELLYGRKIRSNLPAESDCNLCRIKDHEFLFVTAKFNSSLMTFTLIFCLF